MIESIPFYGWFILGIFLGGFLILFFFTDGLLGLFFSTSDNILLKVENQKLRNEIDILSQALVEKESDLRDAEKQLFRANQMLSDIENAIEGEKDEN